MLPDLEFQLVDSSGTAVTAKKFEGKTTLLFFGFTSCPGPCPATLSQIGVALEQLGEAAEGVQVVMVTVDPGRDNPQALERYEKSFGPWLHGLTGGKPELTAVKDTYKIYAERQAAGEDGNYDVAHSLAVFAFDERGHCRLLWSSVADTDAVSSDLLRLISG